MTTLSAGSSQLQLRVGNNGIADWDSNFAQVDFGTDSSPLINGDAFGSSGNVGIVSSNTSSPFPTITPVVLGEIDETTIITAQLTAAAGPVTWSNLTPTTGSPAFPATLTPAGMFSWNPAGSMRGPKGNGVVFSWTATATSPLLPRIPVLQSH